jgi:hypothetical protein
VTYRGIDVSHTYSIQIWQLGAVSVLLSRKVRGSMPVTHGDNDQRVQDLLSKAAPQQSELMSWLLSGARRVLAPSAPTAPLPRQLSPRNNFKMQSLLAALPDPVLLESTLSMPSATIHASHQLQTQCSVSTSTNLTQPPPQLLEPSELPQAQKPSHSFMRTPSTNMKDHQPLVQVLTSYFLFEYF